MTNPRILVVDDEPFNVDYLQQELEDTGYETLSAMDGEEALDRVQTANPDLVLLDIMMPKMDGFQVLKRLKADPLTRDIPVIVISANSDLQSMVAGIRLGAEDYLPKPFEPVLLHARIASSLERKRLHDVEVLYRKSLERELEIAREIQKSFLPSDLPVVAGWDIGTLFRAAREVAGDFYDAFVLPNGSLVCVIGDVCGKGVGAALFMSLFRSLIRVTVANGNTTDRDADRQLLPTERLQRAVSFTNRYVVETHGEQGMFATMFICLSDPQRGVVTYINCGNDPPLWLRDGQVVAELEPTGPIVGIIPEARFFAREITMEVDDVLLAYSDGVTDALSEQGESFGTERLLMALTDGSLTAAGLSQRIENLLGLFVGSARQFDDITLLALRNTAVGSP